MKISDKETIVAKIVNAVYYYDKPRIYRPNFKEIDSKQFCCPKCKMRLSVPRTRIYKIVYECPQCKFKIPEERLLNSKERIEEYNEENRKRTVDNLMKEQHYKK